MKPNAESLSMFLSIAEFGDFVWIVFFHPTFSQYTFLFCGFLRSTNSLNNINLIFINSRYVDCILFVLCSLFPKKPLSCVFVHNIEKLNLIFLIFSISPAFTYKYHSSFPTSRIHLKAFAKIVITLCLLSFSTAVAVRSA